MSTSTMRARLLSAVTLGSSWGGGYISPAQAAEIVDNVLKALREPDEAMTRAGDAETFTRMIEAVIAQRPKAVIVGEATIVVSDYSSAKITTPEIGDDTA